MEMGRNEERPKSIRIRIAEKVIPEKIRSFFTGAQHRQTYFVQGLLVSNMMTEYVLSIMITYLTDVWGLKLLVAVLVTNLQEGLAAISQIFMAYLADSRFGYFWLLFCSTIGYCIGLGLLSYSYPKFTIEEDYRCWYNNDCPTKPLEFPFFVALALITFGQSGARLSLEEFKPVKDGTSQQAEGKEDGTNQAEGKQKKFICFKWIIDSVVGFFKGFKDGEKKEKKFIRLSWIILSVVGSLVGSFALPYAPIEWKSELRICAYMMAASFFVYWLGTLFYNPDGPQQSPLSSVRQVVISALRNRRCSYEEVENLIVLQNGTNEACNTHPKDGGANANHEDANYETYAVQESNHSRSGGLHEIENHTNSQEDGDGYNGLKIMDNGAQHENSNKPQNQVVLSTGTLRCLNKAAVDCSVRVIEDTKHFIRMLPIFTTFLMYGIVKSIGNTFFLEQGSSMDKTFGSIENFPLQAFVLLSHVVRKVTSKIYDLIISRRTRSTKRMSSAIKIGIGLVISIICCIAAALIETKRLSVIKVNDNLSVFWLTPQFVLLGAMNGLVHDGIEGFFDHQAPTSMKRYGSALAEGVSGVGTILSLGMIFAVKKVTGGKHRVSWFTDNIDSSHLDYFCYALAVVATINLIFYYMVARTYSYEQNTDDDNEKAPEVKQQEDANSQNL